ncbi:hypothetical protein [Mesorhizobium sp. 1B3]|uniref:hypothetical protein n=1 Tax=Mesorhizobium sp. 1B3 TaxID=3243599 RepID=UPI003D9807E3
MTAWLLAAAGAAIAFLFSFIQGRLTGARAEHNANRAREADIYEKHLQEIAEAAGARNAVRRHGVPDDKYRRD